MGNLKYEEKQDSTPEKWNFRENPELRAMLDHIALLLAKEYVERMSSSDK